MHIPCTHTRTHARTHTRTHTHTRARARAHKHTQKRQVEVGQGWSDQDNSDDTIEVVPILKKKAQVSCTLFASTSQELPYCRYS